MNGDQAERERERVEEKEQERYKGARSDMLTEAN
jgi:hypothetical protein